MGACHRFAGGFAGAQPRLAKIAQYIAIFRLSAVAPYLRTPEEESFEPAPSTHQYSPMNERVGATGRSPEQPNCERSEVRG